MYQNLDRRNFLKSFGLGMASLALGDFCSRARLAAATKSRRQPNILFLFTDDQRFSALGALDKEEVKTPNMDKIMRNGLTFTRAHIMGSMSGAVCMPSRAMLMTGRTLFHLQNYGSSIPPDQILLPELLRSKGYQTFATGKWHNGRSAFARAFTSGDKIFFGGMANHLKVPVYDFDPTGKYPKSKAYIGEKFSSILFSDAIIKFLQEYKSDSPFFAYVSYTAPHDPRMAPREYADMYPPDKIKLPKNFKPEHPFDNGELKIRDEELAPWPRTPEIIREHIAAYYAMITHLDAQIGRVMKTLEQTGRADNTIIIFAGDNGLAVGQHGLLGKQNLYEHSVRVPLIMAGPDIPQNKNTEALCYLNDIYPTVCDILDLEIPESVESISLLPVIQNKKKSVRDNLFYVYKHVQRGVRGDRWKLIKYHVQEKYTTQLFDLNKDPWELNNLANEPAQESRLKKMNKLLQQWMKKLDDPDLADFSV